jgi:Flp pilus assembly protein TadD
MARASSRDLLRSASKLAIAAATATLLTGCGGFSSIMSSSEAAPDNQMAGSPQELIRPDDRDFIGGAAYWGAKFEANHGDMNAALSFARNLRLMGGARQAVTVMKDVVMSHPDDTRVLAEYGKALTAAGRAPDAVPFLARASQINGNDWSTLSAYGVALDQIGSHGPARDNYEAALKLSPGNSAIQSNLALSYLLEGKIAQAEPILRQLVARPDATPQMRQNLAMVESIRGNKVEAETLVRGDLPKSDADNNISVLNQLSASNAAVDVQPLSAPPSAAPTPAPVPAAPQPAAATLAPTSSPADSEVAASPKTEAIDQATPAAAPLAPKPVARQIVTMAPIADDDAAPTKRARAKPAAASTGTTPAAASTSVTPATTPTATTTPAATTTPEAPAALPTTGPAATAQPTPTSAQPDGSQTSLRSSQPTDPFRPQHEVNVANATP